MIPRAHQVLAILRGNTGWWMTISDLAIWVYGYDDAAETHAIRMMIHRLRVLGYVPAVRDAPWSAPVCRGKTQAYRLIEQAGTVAVSA
jgi:hypothetical protein